MAERKVNGKEWFFFIDPAGGTSYKLLVCLTSNSLHRTSSSIDAASYCGPDTRPGAQTVTVDVAGQVMFEPDADHVSEGDLHDLWDDATVIGWKLSRGTPVDGDLIYSGTGSILTLNTTSDLNGMLTFDANIGVTGVPTKTVYAGS